MTCVKTIRDLTTPTREHVTVLALFTGDTKQKTMFDVLNLCTSDVCLQMYEFPECDSDEDEEFKQQDRELKASVPFAVVGSNTILEVAGRKIRGRQYPWGVVDGKVEFHSPKLHKKITGFSGKPQTQRLYQTTHHADIHPHARPEGCH